MEEISVDDIIISPEHLFDNIPLYPIPLKGLPALRAVFKDYLPVLPSLNLRPVVIKEVKKMINCQNPESGTYYVVLIAIFKNSFPLHVNHVSVPHVALLSTNNDALPFPIEFWMSIIGNGPLRSRNLYGPTSKIIGRE